MPKPAKPKIKRVRNTLNMETSSENRQFAVVLVMGIVFCLVIVFMLWLQSVRPAEPLETYVVETSDSGLSIVLLVDGVVQPKVMFPVELTMVNQSNNQILFQGSVTVESDDQGVFRGVIPDAADMVGTQYLLTVKGPKHQQLKFDNVVAQSGELNLTSRPLPAGDLPWNGTQDKVVDENDYQAVVTRIGSTDPSDLAIADLDFNGVVNDADRSLLLKAFRPL